MSMWVGRALNFPLFISSLKHQVFTSLRNLKLNKCPERDSNHRLSKDSYLKQCLLYGLKCPVFKSVQKSVLKVRCSDFRCSVFRWYCIFSSVWKIKKVRGNNTEETTLKGFLFVTLRYEVVCKTAILARQRWKEGQVYVKSLMNSP